MIGVYDNLVEKDFTHLDIHNLFDLNKKEKDIIIKHMWPLTIIPPRYIESFIITLVDKYCALKESYNYYSGKVVSKKFLRYASFLLLAFIIHIP